MKGSMTEVTDQTGSVCMCVCVAAAKHSLKCLKVELSACVSLQ